MNIMTNEMELAIFGNDFDEVKRLLESGESANARTEFGGDTTLYLAALVNSCSLISLLIEHGADVNAINENGQTPLFAAHKQREILLLVEAGADIHAKDESGETALHFAARGGSTEAVALFLHLGLDMYEKSEAERTAPECAFEADEPYGVLAIFKIAGYDFAGENGQYTPLHYLVHLCRADPIPWILKNGANPSYVDSEGRTAHEFLDYIYELPPEAKSMWGWSQERLDPVKSVLDAHKNGKPLPSLVRCLNDRRNIFKGSPNTHLDMDAFEELTDRYFAAQEHGDVEAMREVAGQIKLSPGMALAALENVGKKEFLSYGFDLSFADTQLEEGWLDRYGD